MVLFVAVVVPLIINGASEAWFGYRDQRSNLSSRLRAEANSAAGQIQAFLDGVRAQMDWTVQLPWLEGLDDRHRFDALRLLRQAPAITEVTLVDGKGIERLHVSRTDADVAMSGVDTGADSGCGAPAQTATHHHRDVCNREFECPLDVDTGRP